MSETSKGPARPIVFGNWKMNGLRADGLKLAGDLAERAAKLSGTLGVFPPATLLHQVAKRVAGSGIVVGGQDAHEAQSGAFTGSVSAAMLKDAGATAVLVGHSERRHGLNEGDALVLAKAEAALKAGLLLVLCVGETEAEYDAEQTLDVLKRQVAHGLPAAATADNTILAYEPVWAIGTGKTPTTDEIAKVHAELRAMVAGRIEGGGAVALLYGGSVKPSNAGEILALQDVDGALVGGASLAADDFWRIYQAGGGA